MVAQGTSGTAGVSAGERPPVASSAEVASGGINDTRDLTRLGGAMINDIIGGRMTAKVANPVVRTGNMMLRAVDLEHRHNDGRAIPTA